MNSYDKIKFTILHLLGGNKFFKFFRVDPPLNKESSIIKLIDSSRGFILEIKYSLNSGSDDTIIVGFPKYGMKSKLYIKISSDLFAKFETMN